VPDSVVVITDYRLQTTNRKWYTAYQIAADWMTFNDIQGHSSKPFPMWIFVAHICTAVEKISTEISRLTIPMQQLSLLGLKLSAWCLLWQPVTCHSVSVFDVTHEMRESVESFEIIGKCTKRSVQIEYHFSVSLHTSNCSYSSERSLYAIADPPVRLSSVC